MNVTCIVKERKFTQIVCPSRDILYRWMNLFYCSIHLTTTVTLKPANIPALGYNQYRSFVVSCASDAALQCFSSSRPWKYYTKVLRERFPKGGRYSPALLSFFPIACFLVDPFSECVMGFTTVDMIKTDTLCNENNYGTARRSITWNIMLYKCVADSKFIFLNIEVFGKIYRGKKKLFIPYI